MSVEADPAVVRLGPSEANSSTKEGLKRLNFLKRYRALKVQKHRKKKTNPGETEKNPIVIEDKLESDKPETSSNGSFTKWYQSFMAENAEEKSDKASDSTGNSKLPDKIKEENTQGDVEEIGGDEEQEEEPEQYYTFKAKVARSKPRISHVSADQMLFEKPQTNKFVDFFFTPAEKMRIAGRFKKMVGAQGKDKHMNLDLFDTDIQSMPMVNSFSRSNGEWGLNEEEDEDYGEQVQENDVQGSNEYLSQVITNESEKPTRHVQRRSERIVKPNGETREIIEEEFIERAEKKGRNRIFAGDPSSFESDLAQLYRNRRTPAPHNSSFKRRMKEFQYYINGVDMPGYKRSSSFLNKALPDIPATRARSSRRGNTALRSKSGNTRMKNYVGTPSYANADLGLLKHKLIEVLHTNYDANILDFHASVRKLLSMVPVISYIEPFLADLEVAIPKNSSAEFTNPAALMVAMIDGIISLMAMYWGIKFYIVIARAFKSVLWVLVRVGIV